MRRPQAQIDSIFRSVCLFCFHFSSFLAPNTEANGRAAAGKEQNEPDIKLGTIPGLRKHCSVVIAGISSVAAVIGFSGINARSRCSTITRFFCIAARCGRAAILPVRELCNLGILIALQVADGALLVLQTWLLPCQSSTR